MTIGLSNGSLLDGTASANTYTTMGGTSTINFFNTDAVKQREDYRLENSSMENAALGREAVINEKIEHIMSYLESGQEDKVLEAYNELIEEMSSQKEYTGNGDEANMTESQLKALAKTKIENALMEKYGEKISLEDYIRDNARDASGVATQKALTWGNCDSTSQEDLLEAMCGIKEEKGKNYIATFGAAIVSPFAKLGNVLFQGGKKQ